MMIPLGDVQHLATGSNDQRDVSGASENCGVGAGAAIGQHDSRDQRGVEPSRVRRCQVPRHEDALGERLPRGGAGERPEHLLRDRFDVLGSLAQVGVG